MARLVVDPVTRIEGHLRIEAQMDGGKISDAWSAGTMFRGIELILKDRDPREAWIWAQRICGVCTMVHALASVRAVENALADRSSGKCAHRPQPDRRLADGAGSRGPLLSSARARLGGCRLGAQSRSGEDLVRSRNRFRTTKNRAPPISAASSNASRRWSIAAS